jgi:hypothetical protein
VGRTARGRKNKGVEKWKYLAKEEVNDKSGSINLLKGRFLLEYITGRLDRFSRH